MVGHIECQWCVMGGGVVGVCGGVVGVLHVVVVAEWRC